MTVFSHLSGFREFFRVSYGNGGPTSTRKNSTDGPPLMLFVQTNGITGEFVVKAAFQLTRLVEDWI
jgi:hypothetical protein